MKLFYIVLIFFTALVSCDNRNKDTFNKDSCKVINSLIANNYKYFINESKNNYKMITEYRLMEDFDSIMTIVKTNNYNKDLLNDINIMFSRYTTINISTDSICELIEMDRDYYFGFLRYLFSCELIKEYNNHLIRMPLHKVNIDKNYDTIAVGETFSTKINLVVANNEYPFYAITSDTLQNVEGGLIPYYKAKGKKPGKFSEIVKFYYYSPKIMSYKEDSAKIVYYVK